MNCVINWILLTIPLRPFAFCRRAYFALSSKNFSKRPAFVWQLVVSYVTVGVACFILQRPFAETVKSATYFPFGTIRFVHVLTSFRVRESGWLFEKLMISLFMWLEWKLRRNFWLTLYTRCRKKNCSPLLSRPRKRVIVWFPLSYPTPQKFQKLPNESRSFAVFVKAAAKGGSRREAQTVSTKFANSWFIKKSPSTTGAYFTHEYELCNQLNKKTYHQLLHSQNDGQLCKAVLLPAATGLKKQLHAVGGVLRHGGRCLLHTSTPVCRNRRYTRAAGRKMRHGITVLFLWNERPGNSEAP